MIKSAFSILFIVVLALISGSILLTDSVDASDKDAPSSSGFCGDQVRWAYDADNKKLTISGNGDMEDYVVFQNSCYAPWANKYDSTINGRWIYHLDTVEFKGSITSIGNAAFTSLTIGNLIMCDSITNIGDSSFLNAKINHITFSKGLESIGNDAFRNSKISSGFNLPSNLNNVERFAFYESTLPSIVVFPEGMTVIDFSLGEVKGVTKLVMPSTLKIVKQYAFQGMTDLKTIDFTKCKDLESIESCIFDTPISELTIPSAKSIELKNDTLQKLTLNGKVSNLVLICPNLKSIDVTDESGFIVRDDVIYSEDMREIIFYPSSKTDSEYTIPDTVVSAHISNSNLKKLTIPNSVNSIYISCPNLSVLNVPSNLKKIDGLTKGLDVLCVPIDYDVEMKALEQYAHVIIKYYSQYFSEVVCSMNANSEIRIDTKISNESLFKSLDLGTSWGLSDSTSSRTTSLTIPHDSLPFNTLYLSINLGQNDSDTLPEEKIHVESEKATYNLTMMLGGVLILLAIVSFFIRSADLVISSLGVGLILRLISIIPSWLYLIGGLFCIFGINFIY